MKSLFTRAALLGASVIAFGAAASAHAEERPFCSGRPGMGTSPCALSPGRVMLETGVDWQRIEDDTGLHDTTAFGQAILRVGVTSTMELNVGWNGFTTLRDRDQSGEVAVDHGAADALIALKYNLKNPDGSGVSIALYPFLTVPVGKRGIGLEHMSAGLVVPVTLPLPHEFSLDIQPQISAVVDDTSTGHNITWGTTVTLARPVTARLTLQAEVGWQRVETVERGESTAYVGFAGGYMLTPRLQLDVGINLRLLGQVADHQVFFGMSRLF
ncbi:transporter [Novosphingobium ovatum]|nr:transporter [Novosphingobium ovatum]